MFPDSVDEFDCVKSPGQLAQLTSCLSRLGTALFLCGAALTLLVIGFPHASLACMREAIR